MIIAKGYSVTSGYRQFSIFKSLNFEKYQSRVDLIAIDAGGLAKPLTIVGVSR